MKSMNRRILHASYGRHRVAVYFYLHEDVELLELKEFIIDALEAWGGQRRPDDPLHSSLKRVNVSYLPLTYAKDRKP